MAGTKPYPDSAERRPPRERHVDVSELSDKQTDALHWMSGFDRGVTSRCAVYDGFSDDPKRVARVLKSLWEETDLVDRREFRQETDKSSRNVAHLYWLTPAGKAAVLADSQ